MGLVRQSILRCFLVLRESFVDVKKEAQKCFTKAFFETLRERESLLFDMGSSAKGNFCFMQGTVGPDDRISPMVFCSVLVCVSCHTI